MNTTQLECFVEVAGTLSFSKAAQNLHLSQPTVSHQIKALEDELGCTLFVRSTRTVRLTDEGFTFLEYANELLDLTIRSKRQLEHNQRPEGQQLHIGVHDGIEAQLIAPVLRRISEESPDFEPVIRMAPFGALHTMLENGQADVVIENRDPAGEPSGASVFRRLVDFPAVCVCAPENPLAERRGLVLDDLKSGGRMAVGDPHHCSAALVSIQRRAIAAVPPERVMMGYNVEISLALARAGVAFSVLSGIPTMESSQVRYVPVEDLPAITMGVLVRRGRRPELLNRFIEMLRDELAHQVALQNPTKRSEQHETAA